MLMSMTGFGRADFDAGDFAWCWELRSVNARGLEVRFRLPAGCDGLEPALRETTQKSIRRGNLQATLTLRQAPASNISIDEALLGRLMDSARNVAARFPGTPAPRVEAFFDVPGVVGICRMELEPDGTCLNTVRAGFETALQALLRARQSEGGRLMQCLGGLLEEIAALRTEAEREAGAQCAVQRDRLVSAVAALTQAHPGLPEDRLAQELALLAAKSDIREELDRLSSHLAAAQDYLSQGGPVGRQLDFLVQELVRETNTICSKSASTALTSVGLKLKGVVEQVREQVQNLE